MKVESREPVFPRAWRGLLAGAAAAVLLGACAASAQPAPEPPSPTEPDSLALHSESDRTAPETAEISPHDRRLVSMRKVRLDAGSHNVVRSGPGEGFAIAGVYPKGTTFTVIAKNGDWYNVRLSDTETAWIHASLCKEFEDLSDLEFRSNPKLYTRTGTFVLSGYTGAYAFDRKSNSLVVGGRVGYYVFDRLQFEGGLAWTHVRRPAEIVETLFGLTLEAEDFHMVFYSMNLTWELLPGRQMVPYLSAGVGSSIMQGETEPSINFGAGTTLFLSKRMATRWEVRGYRFDSGSDASRVTNDNVEFTLGTLFLF